MKYVMTVAVVSFWLLGNTLPAAETGGPGEALNNLMKAPTAAKSFRLRLQSLRETKADEEGETTTASQEVLVQNPNRLAIRATTGKEPKLVFTAASDGQTFGLSLPEFGYVKKAAPATLKDLLADEDLTIGLQLGQARWAMLAVSGALAELGDKAKTMDYAGIAKVDDQPCHRFRFSLADNTVLEAWILQAAPGTLRRLTLSVNRPAAGDDPAVNLKETVNLTWELDVEVPAEAFAFQPPADSKEGKSLQALYEEQSADNFRKQLEEAGARRFKGQPIPAGKDAYTHFDYEKMSEGFNVRLLRTAYETCGDHNDAWDQTMLELADGVAKATIETWPRRSTDYGAMLKMVEKCRAAGCRDPLLPHLHGLILAAQKRYGDAEKQQAEACKGMTGSKYPDLVQFYAINHLWASRREQRRGLNAEELARWRDLLPKALTTIDLKSGERRRLVADLKPQFTSLKPEVQKQILEPLLKTAADNWAVNQLAGEYHVDEAWRQRGCGWASEVKEAGWKGFAANLELAYTYLKKAWTIDPRCPESCSQLIAVAMGGHRGENEGVRYWFDQAVNAQMDYAPAYSAYAWAIYPRWGGSVAALNAFLEECIATGRFDTPIPARCLDLVYAMDNNQDGDHRFGERAEIRASLKRVADGYDQSGYTRKLQQEIRSAAAALAFRSGDLKETRELLEKLGTQADVREFGRFGISCSRCRRETYAYTSPQADAIKAAEALGHAGKYDEALNAVAALMPETKHPEVKAHLKDLEIGNKIQKALATGNWVALPAKDGLPGWTPVYGDWKAENGEIVGSSGAGGLLILLDAFPGLNYELTAEVEVKASGCQKGQDAAIVIDHDGTNWHSVVVHDGFRDCRILDGFDDELKKSGAIIRNQNQVHIVRQGTQLQVAVNNDKVFDFELKTQGVAKPETLQLGLGSKYCCGTTTARFRSFKLRRLDVVPAAK